MVWAQLRVPASSANLGPGFDALGLALTIYLDCRFRAAEVLTIRVSGCDAQSIPVDETNLIWRTAFQVAQDAGFVMPPVELHIENAIPLGKGLGSSAAALIAGVIIADRVLQLNWSHDRILDVAACLEGHPDNVAPCVLGGIVASAIDSNQHVVAIRMELPETCAIAVIVPDFVLPTAESRGVLPDSYSRQDAVFNIQRVGLLVASFATGTTAALQTALADRIHQPFRARLVPGLQEVIAFRTPGLFGCVLSGAGPSILIFFDRQQPDVCEKVQDIVSRNGWRASILHASVCTNGYELS